MGRPSNELARIRPPFGGRVVDPRDSRPIDPHHCVDDLNVHTANGTIEKRRGFSRVGEVANNDLPLFLRGIHIKNDDFLAYTGLVSYGIMDPDNGATVLSAVNLASANCSITQFKNVVYFPNLNTKVYVNSSTGAWLSGSIGIAAPTQAPTPTDTAGNMVAGTYSYRYTFYNANTGTESPPGEERQLTIAANRRIIVGVTASPDAQVTNIRLYRKYVGGDSQWFFRAQVTNASQSFDDNSNSIDKSSASALNVTDGVPPPGNFCIPFKNRMFWRDDSALFSGLARPATTMLVSEYDRPEQVNVNSRFQFGDADNDGIVGGIAAFGVLIIFCQRSIWTLSGDSPAGYVREKIADGIGCINIDTIRADPVSGAVYWCDSQGAYSFDGGRITYLAQQVWSDFRDNLPRSASFDIRTGLYLVQAGNTGLSGFVFAYDTKRGNWFKWLMDVTAMSDVTNRLRRLYFSEANGNNPFISLYRGTVEISTDNGAPIPWKWVTPKMDFGTTKRKTVRYLRLGYTQNQAGETIDVRHAVDDGNIAGATTAKSRTATPRVLRYPLNRRADNIKLEIGGTSSVATEIAAIDIDGEQTGWR